MSDKTKRPMSAYIIWLNSNREQIKADNPGLKVTEIAKKGGEIWRSMTDKSVWEEKAAKAKEEYLKDLETYNAEGGGGERTETTQERQKTATPTETKKMDSEKQENNEKKGMI